MTFATIIYIFGLIWINFWPRKITSAESHKRTQTQTQNEWVFYIFLSISKRIVKQFDLCWKFDGQTHWSTSQNVKPINFFYIIIISTLFLPKSIRIYNPKLHSAMCLSVLLCRAVYAMSCLRFVFISSALRQLCAFICHSEYLFSFRKVQ